MDHHSSSVEALYIARDVEDNRTKLGFELLCSALGKYSIQPVSDLESADAMITIGGDGAFLHAARQHDFSPVPITGISTGTLGFYMSTLPTEESVDYMVRNLAEGDYRVHNLPLLELRNIGGTLIKLAANDIVVKADGFQAFKAGLTISNSQFEHFVGNGLCFSTPQGSSGEGLANGGPFIREGLPVWAIVPEALHPSKEYHSLVSPMILGAEDEVLLEVKEAFKRPFVVGTDGMVVKEWQQDETKLVISLSKDKAIRRIRLNNNTYLKDVSRIFRGMRADT